MSRELFYIRDGVVNNGAIEFNIPISSEVDYLHFLWYNADDTNVIKYKIVVKVLNSEVMFQPSLNISHSGEVPNTPTYWVRAAISMYIGFHSKTILLSYVPFQRMSLPCNELVSQKASLEIHIDLGETTFKLIRDKYCTSNTVTPAFQPKSATISSHVVFVYSTLVAFIIALSVTVLVTMMQKVITYFNRFE